MALPLVFSGVVAEQPVFADPHASTVTRMFLSHLLSVNQASWTVRRIKTLCLAWMKMPAKASTSTGETRPSMSSTVSVKSPLVKPAESGAHQQHQPADDTDGPGEANWKTTSTIIGMLPKTDTRSRPYRRPGPHQHSHPVPVDPEGVTITRADREAERPITRVTATQ